MMLAMLMWFAAIAAAGVGLFLAEVCTLMLRDWRRKRASL